jgi:hypothetical protein
MSAEAQRKTRAKLRELKKWATLWSRAVATTAADKGWQNAAKEVLHILTADNPEGNAK